MSSVLLFDFADDFSDLLVPWKRTTFLAGKETTWGESLPAEKKAASDIMAVPPQPLSSKELIKAEDGEYVRDLEKTYTSFVVNTREGERPADQLVYKDECGKCTRYEVFQLEDRTAHGNFRKVYLRKLQGDQSEELPT